MHSFLSFAFWNQFLYQGATEQKNTQYKKYIRAISANQ